MSNSKHAKKGTGADVPIQRVTFPPASTAEITKRLTDAGPDGWLVLFPQADGSLKARVVKADGTWAGDDVNDSIQCPPLC